MLAAACTERLQQTPNKNKFKKKTWEIKEAQVKSLSHIFSNHKWSECHFAIHFDAIAAFCILHLALCSCIWWNLLLLYALQLHIWILHALWWHINFSIVLLFVCQRTVTLHLRSTDAIDGGKLTKLITPIERSRVLVF